MSEWVCLECGLIVVTRFPERCADCDGELEPYDEPSLSAEDRNPSMVYEP